MNTVITSRPEAAISDAISGAAKTAPRVNWLRVAWFLGLAFGLAWLVDLVIYLNGGLANPATVLLLQFQMLLPAFSALLLQAFIFKDSPIYFRNNRSASRWFVYFYFVLTGLYLIGSVVSLIQPELLASIGVRLFIPNVIGLILLVVLRLVGGKNTFVEAGMAGGRVRIWIGYAAGIIIFYGVQTWLNFVFKLGRVVDVAAAFPQMVASTNSATLTVLSLAVNVILVGPLLGLIVTFGEEYGWRGFLQSELIRLGRIRGVLILGIIWGIWHWPVIWMGYNYPGEPLIGSLMMVAYCVVLAYFLAYAVFKSQGIWTAAYLHAISNQSLSFFMMAVVAPTSMLLSFGIGIPALALGVVVVLLLLRDPIWHSA